MTPETTKTCATCVHWKQNMGWTDLYSPRNDYEIEEEDPERWAQIQQHNREGGICKKVDVGWHEDDGSGPLPLASCWDGSRYAASLHTHRDFGCILHEETGR